MMEKNHSKMVFPPIAFTLWLRDNMDGSIPSLMPVIPPAISVALTEIIAIKPTMKQAKMKSVHATVFNPAGITNSSANAAKIMQSIV